LKRRRLCRPSLSQCRHPPIEVHALWSADRPSTPPDNCRAMNRLGRRPPLGILMSERLLVAVARSKATVPLSTEGPHLGPEADWRKTTRPSHLPARPRTTAVEKRCRSSERQQLARYGRSADSGGTPVALREDRAELPGCRRGKAWCSSLHASALFRAFYSCEYALRPDREDIIR
jgi:hypothetical protein